MTRYQETGDVYLKAFWAGNAFSLFEDLSETIKYGPKLMSREEWNRLIQERINEVHKRTD